MEDRRGVVGMPPVYIIIVTWNSMKYIPGLFSSLYKMSYKDFRIVLVDNGSSDNVVEWVKEHYPETIITKNRKNFGFTKANNIGIKIALKKGADYIGFLNADMVVDRDWLSELVSTLNRRKDVGIVCSKILFMDMPWIVNSTGVITNIDMFSIDRDFAKVDTYSEEERETIAASGGAMLIRSEVFKKIGLFDTLFFSYYEDVDLSFRLRRYTAYKILNNPRSIVYHKMWSSTRKIPEFREFLLSKNNYIMIFKYLPFKVIPIRALRIFKVRVERKFYWNDMLREYRAFFSALVQFIPSLIKRIYMDIKFGVNWEYMDMLEDTKGIPIPPPFPPDYTERRKEIFPEKLPSRILFGINDKFIGNGWSILKKDKDGLRYRIIEGKKGEIYLSPPKPKNIFLQVHIKWKGRLNIFVDGEHIDTYIGKNRWETALVPIKFRAKKSHYKITIEAGGAMVNEVALIEENSPILRRII